VYVHQPATREGLELEFLSDGRPTAWLRPGSSAESATWAMTWHTDRLLLPDQEQLYAGLAVRPYRGLPVAQVRRWRDEARERLGLEAPSLPAWALQANIVEFNTDPVGYKPVRGKPVFTRLDDPRCHEALARWREMGFNVLYMVAPNHTGEHCLSPLDYAPNDHVGGAAGEAQALRWAHELGFHVVLWVTTVGLDRGAPQVREHPDWFTHLPDGSCSSPFGAYAADADSLSTGWRRWLGEQVADVVARGYDGIFVDGLVPRSSNHLRWNWPGEGRNAVQDLVADLGRALRRTRPGLLLFVEDENVAMQAASGFTVGRYQPAAPKPKQHWSGIGMPAAPEPNGPRIPPELARDYLRMRYASLLPGAVTCDMIEGYYSRAARPWTVQNIVCGAASKTFSTSVDGAETFELIADAGEPPETERTPEHRRRGHEEFCRLLRLRRDEPLLGAAPLSFDAVEIAGDDAVVGILRPCGERALLAVIQFADRAARIQLRLAAPDDVPTAQRALAGAPHEAHWRATERMCSFDDVPLAGSLSIAPGAVVPIALAPYGFRVFDLRGHRH
jgi:hypothetical protein